mgnify:CR=1 FL=1
MHKLGELGRAHLALVRFLARVESQVGLEVAGAAKSLVANLQCGEEGREGRGKDQKIKSCQREGHIYKPTPSNSGGEKPSCGTYGVALSKQGDVATLRMRRCLFPPPFSTHWKLAMSSSQLTAGTRLSPRDKAELLRWLNLRAL